MVNKERSVYLVIGYDSPAKDRALQQIKQELLPGALIDFNFERVYAQELTLIALQEKLLCLPMKAKKRLLLIKNAQRLKAELKEYLLAYCAQPAPHVALIIDVDEPDVRDEFLQEMGRLTKTVLRKSPRVDTFLLSRQIEDRQAPQSLKTLRILLDNGEPPERILGGLRYAFENRASLAARTATRLKFLLACDSDIKTGRVKPEHALEKLVVGLCCFRQA